MSNNQYGYKRRYAPEWYENGPVKIYTREEIDEYEKTCDSRVWEKYNAEMSLNPSDRMYLDRLDTARSEEMMEDLMHGVAEVEDNKVKE